MRKTGGFGAWAALSPRAGRAITLMFLAVVVIGATAVYYLRPSGSLGSGAPATAARPFPVQRAGDTVSYSFVSLALGWAAETALPRGSDQSGPFTIFKTVDAGMHWHKQLSGNSSELFATLFTFRFVDAYHGFVLAGEPLALNRTSDGGDHWTRLAMPTADPATVQIPDARNLWLLAKPGHKPADPFQLFVSADGGDTWTQRPDTPDESYFYPTFRNGSEGWSGAYDPVDPHLYVTLDGALTWERRDLPPDRERQESVATSVRLLPKSGVVVYTFPPSSGPQTNLLWNYTSLDGGRTWSPVTRASPGGDTGSYAFQDDTHWWSLQFGALYKTDNAGRTWSPTAVEPRGLVLQQVFDLVHARALLDEGYGTELVFTADGGLHWTRTNVPIPE